MCFCIYSCLRISLYSRKQPFCWTRRAHSFANSTFDTRKFVLGSCILIYTEQFICFLLLNFRLIYPVSSPGLPGWFLLYLRSNYLREFLYRCEGFLWSSTNTVCRGCCLLFRSTSCFPITFEKLGSHVLSMAHISFDCNYFLWSLVKLKKEGGTMTQVSFLGTPCWLLSHYVNNLMREWSQNLKSRGDWFTFQAFLPSLIIALQTAILPCHEGALWLVSAVQVLGATMVVAW